MNKTDFVRLMGRVNHIRQEDAAKYLDIVLKTITEGLRKEDEIITTVLVSSIRVRLVQKMGLTLRLEKRW